MKPTSFALCTILAFGLCAPAAHASRSVALQERSERVEAPQGLRSLVIENPRGWVHLRPSPDGQLRVAAIKVCRAESQARARRFATETSVHAGREGDLYAVRVTYPRKVDVRISFWDLFKESNWENGGFLPRSEVRLVVDVPTGLPVRVTTASGDLDSEALAGAQVLRTASGDVSVRRARGAVDVSTSSGDVEASDVGGITVSTASGDLFFNGTSGPVRARSSSGDITVNGARDSLVIRTSSGDVSIDDSPRALVLETSSGEIGVRSATGGVKVTAASGSLQLRLRGPLRSADLAAASGDIQLELAPGMDATLEASSSGGEIANHLKLAGEHSGRGTLSGRVGRGGAPVRVETTNGDITLTGGGK